MLRRPDIRVLVLVFMAALTFSFLIQLETVEKRRHVPQPVKEGQFKANREISLRLSQMKEILGFIEHGMHYIQH